MKKFILYLGLITTVGTAQAGNLYIGAKYMMMSADVEAFGTTGGTADPTGLALILGNELSSRLAIEGTFLASNSNGSFDGLATGNKLKMNSLIDVSVIGKNKLSPDFSIYGRAGLAIYEFKDSDGDTAGNTGLSLGIGANVSVGQSANMFIEYLLLPDADYDDFPGWSIISVSSINIGAAVKF